MERKVPFIIGEQYHVYNRGVDKHNIFFVDRDWDMFQWLLYVRNGNKRIDIPKFNPSKPAMSLGGPWRQDTGDALVDIIAYVMMPNHFHLILHERVEGGITKFMSRLLTSYSMYMNAKYNRTGPLMCRPFRSKHINSDEYFRWLMSYIHLNPVDLIEKDWKEKGIRNFAKVKKYIHEYKYSSYPDYFGKERGEALIVNKEALLMDIKDLENITEMAGEVLSPLVS